MVWKCCALAVHLYAQTQHHIVNDWKAADASQRQSYSCTSLQIFQPVWSWTNHMRFALTFRLRLFTHTILNFVLWVFRDSVVSRIKSKHLNHQGSDRIGWCWKTFFLFFFKIWHCAKVYFCWRDGRRARNPAAAEMSSTLGHPVILWLTITSV